MAAEKNACSRLEEFGGKVKEGLGQRIRDTGVANDGKLGHGEPNVNDAVYKIKDALT
ncbi:MAG TPA: CsbD family protein [Mycobacterium sp.]|nr:CsbD family protein [Mycobacterium sp.]